MDEESYEKSLIMYVVIGEPRQIAGKLKQENSSELIPPTGLDSFIFIYFYYLQREKKEVKHREYILVALYNQLINYGHLYNDRPSFLVFPVQEEIITVLNTSQI